MRCMEQKVIQHSEVRLIKPQAEERKALKSSACRRDVHSTMGCCAWRKSWERPNEVVMAAHNNA